jgi:hypothetical protein
VAEGAAMLRVAGGEAAWVEVLPSAAAMASLH